MGTLIRRPLNLILFVSMFLIMSPEVMGGDQFDPIIVIPALEKMANDIPLDRFDNSTVVIQKLEHSITTYSISNGDKDRVIYQRNHQIDNDKNVVVFTSAEDKIRTKGTKRIYVVLKRKQGAEYYIVLAFLRPAENRDTAMLIPNLEIHGKLQTIEWVEFNEHILPGGSPVSFNVLHCASSFLVPCGFNSKALVPASSFSKSKREYVPRTINQAALDACIDKIEGDHDHAEYFMDINFAEVYVPSASKQTASGRHRRQYPPPDYGQSGHFQPPPPQGIPGQLPPPPTQGFPGQPDPQSNLPPPPPQGFPGQLPPPPPPQGYPGQPGQFPPPQGYPGQDPYGGPQGYPGGPGQGYPGDQGGWGQPYAVYPPNPYQAYTPKPGYNPRLGKPTAAVIQEGVGPIGGILSSVGGVVCGILSILASCADESEYGNQMAIGQAAAEGWRKNDAFAIEARVRNLAGRRRKRLATDSEMEELRHYSGWRTQFITPKEGVVGVRDTLGITFYGFGNCPFVSLDDKKLDGNEDDIIESYLILLRAQCIYWMKDYIRELIKNKYLFARNRLLEINPAFPTLHEEKLTVKESLFLASASELDAFSKTYTSEQLSPSVATTSPNGQHNISRSIGFITNVILTALWRFEQHSHKHDVFLMRHLLQSVDAMFVKLRQDVQNLNHNCPKCPNDKAIYVGDQLQILGLIEFIKFDGKGERYDFDEFYKKNYEHLNKILNIYG